MTRGKLVLVSENDGFLVLKLANLEGSGSWLGSWLLRNWIFREIRMFLRF